MDMFGDMLKRIGHLVEHEGKSYIRIDQKTWLTEESYVEVDVLIEPPTTMPCLSEMKCLVKTRPRNKTK